MEKEPEVAESSAPLELVRVAASSRLFLLSGWVFVVLVCLSIGFDAVFESRLLDVVGVIVYPLGAFVWWLNRRNAVWVERDSYGVRVLTRRWWKYEDLWSGKLRAMGTVLDEFPADVPVAYDSCRASWWRSDRSLTVDGIRYCATPSPPSSQRLSLMTVDGRWPTTADFDDRSSGSPTA